MVKVPGSQAYEEQAEKLAKRYDAYDRQGVHDWLLDFLPSAPARLLDIGAGTGQDALFFTSLGYRVTAVEPADAFRAIAGVKAGADQIVWIDDALPELAKVNTDGFEIVTMIAVFMHLDKTERRRALERVADLMVSDGVVVMSVRHGEVPEGRRMFEIGDEEIIAIASELGLEKIYQAHAESNQLENRARGVTWSRLGFRKI